jgi:hypothetical protein
MHGSASVRHSNTEVRVLDVNSFRRLEWSGNPWVFAESSDFRGGGEQHAFAAFSPIGKLVGFAWLEIGVADLRFLGSKMQLPDRVGYFSRVWVDEAVRNTGVSKALFCSVQKNALQLGLDRILGTSVPENHTIQAVLKREGWLKCGRVDRYFVALVSYYCIMPVNDKLQRTLFGKKALIRLITPRVTT